MQSNVNSGFSKVICNYMIHMFAEESNNKKHQTQMFNFKFKFQSFIFPERSITFFQPNHRFGPLLCTARRTKIVTLRPFWIPDHDSWSTNDSNNYCSGILIQPWWLRTKLHSIFDGCVLYLDTILRGARQFIDPILYYNKNITEIDYY